MNKMYLAVSKTHLTVNERRFTINQRYLITDKAGAALLI